jgi:ParB-like chromosome segregation protein Spo0J
MLGLMKRSTLAIADIYVPVKRRATLDQKRVHEIAASILDKGLQTPILVRADGARFVLVEGLHRLEAARALGEETIVGFLVEVRKH